MKYVVFPTRQYEKSYKKVRRSGKLSEQAWTKLNRAINTLASGAKLPAEYQDHRLTGKWVAYRECHIKGDLLLVYQIHEDELLLVLMNIGTHPYLGL